MQLIPNPDLRQGVEIDVDSEDNVVPALMNRMDNKKLRERVQVKAQLQKIQGQVWKARKERLGGSEAGGLGGL